MFMCVVNLKSVNKLDLTWKQSFLIILITFLYILSILIIILNSYNVCVL
jgi:hypothetical protein